MHIFKYIQSHIAHLREVSQLRMCVFQERILKVLKCYNSLSAMTTQLLTSGEFCQPHYDTIPVKGASANDSF